MAKKFNNSRIFIALSFWSKEFLPWANVQCPVRRFSLSINIMPTSYFSLEQMGVSPIPVVVRWRHRFPIFRGKCVLENEFWHIYLTATNLRRFRYFTASFHSSPDRRSQQINLLVTSAFSYVRYFKIYELGLL